MVLLMMTTMNSTAERVPRILILGNGLNLAYGRRSVSWKKMITGWAVRDVPDTITVPLSLEVVLRTGNNALEVLRRHRRELYGRVETEALLEALTALLTAGFDEILTTNYSYELEEAALGYDDVTDSVLVRLVRSTTGFIDRKYLLHSYHEVEKEGVTNRIWHIHGEARKPSSLILDHYQYGELLNRFVNFCRWREMERGADEPRLAEKESWLDVYLDADVYILGQGFDFAEMDLWWLLNRKHMEKKHRKVYFYEPRTDREYDAKIELMKLYGVTHVDLGFSMAPKPAHAAEDEVQYEYLRESSRIYREFYKAAIEDIREHMKENETQEVSVHGHQTGIASEAL